MHGQRGVTPSGHLTDANAGVTGGAGIELLLKKINVDKELPKAEESLKSIKGNHQDVDKALKKVKYLRALKSLGFTPSEAYILHHLPVMPPVMRAGLNAPRWHLKFDDVNTLYSDFAKVNEKLKDPILQKNLTDKMKVDLRRDYYDGVKALIGIGVPYEDASYKGLHAPDHRQPAEERATSRTSSIERRQDLTMRSTIVPEPALGLDEVGIPQERRTRPLQALRVHELKGRGRHPRTSCQGPAFIEKKSPRGLEGSRPSDGRSGRCC